MNEDDSVTLATEAAIATRSAYERHKVKSHTMIREKDGLIVEEIVGFTDRIIRKSKRTRIID